MYHYKAAEKAQEKAQEALDKTNEDGSITPEEKAAIDEANKDVETAKEKAADAVDKLPESDVKDSLKDRVNDVQPVEITPNTDEEKPAEQDIQPKINAAKTAAEEAATAKAAAEKDGVVSAEEAKNVNDLIAKAETAKGAAQQAVDGLPAGEYKTAKDGEVKAIDVPTNASETTTPTATVELVEDTGSDAADGVTNNGKITVSVDEPYRVESVTVKGTPLVKGEDGQYQLPEGTYSKDDIQVVVAHAKGGQINANTALSPATVTVDTTAPTEAPEVDGAAEP
ncbi:GA-like domain-containing protein [Gallibacterium anatis]|uniref:GA-like domain-containing protein n=2 Tax=Gallibacterium anatis TaxID=750 RepID=UPI0005322DEC|nr:hypothetical protein [Gallibacterium anatis]KGQ64869.1 hypothetical protein IO47_11435 [Gallibacterium anatis]